ELLPPPPSSPTLPYTTLFRSRKCVTEGTEGLLLRLIGLCRAARIRAESGERQTPRRSPCPARREETIHGEHHDWRRSDPVYPARSEEHTSELQSRENLVCRLL